MNIFNKLIITTDLFMTQRGDQLIQARLQKLDSLRELGINPYPTSYEKTHTNMQAKE